MNRYLAIPFSISLVAFACYLIFETRSQAETGTMPTPVTGHPAVPRGGLLSIDDAKNKLLKHWQTRDSPYQMFYRSRPLPPVYAFAILDETNAENDQLLFTGLLQVVHDQQQTGVPVVVDRISGRILIFAGDQWHTHEHWLENLAPKWPVT